jgi:hypothetical protein
MLATKKFCGKKCADNYRNNSMVTCQSVKPLCIKIFLKNEGVSRFGRWYCSSTCLEQDEEAQRMKRLVENADTARNQTLVEDADE